MSKVMRALLAIFVVTAIVDAQSSTSACNNAVRAATGTPTATKLFGWGSNSQGQLGFESSLSQVAYPQLIQLSSGVVASTVYSGMFHSLLRDGAGGTLWTTGDGTSGQLALGETQLTELSTFSRVEQVVDDTAPNNLGSRKVKHASGGWKHSCAIFTSATDATIDAVFCSGSNDNGQLGHPEVTDSVSLFISVESDDANFATRSFTQVRCGADFSIALDTNGNVWSWGANGMGQLGYESSGETKARMIQNLNNVGNITCGGFFCLALTFDGAVYGWGRQDAGQLAGGSAASSKYQFTPKLIVSSGVTRVRAGGRHVLALINGKLHAWGAGTWGASGIPSTLATGVKADWFIFTPTPIPFFDNINVQSFDAGFKHSIVLDTCGRVFTFGSNALGQLGIGYGGNDFRFMTPREVTTIRRFKLNVLEVRATAYATFVITGS